MKHNNFNLMRLIFSILVVFSHSFGLLNLDEPTIFHRSFGNFAVHCFFAVSGYFITLSFVRSTNFSEFTIKRILRILPAYIIAYLLGKILANLGNGFIDNPVPYIINGPIWTLSWEIFCYLIIGMIGFLGLLNSSILGSVWIVSFILILINSTSQAQVYQVIIPLLFLFLSGAFIALHEEKIKMKYAGLASVVLLFLLEFFPESLSKLISSLPWLYGPGFSSYILDYFVYLLILPPALIYIGKYLNVNMVLKHDISYGVYIYTWPVQQFLIYYATLKSLNITPYSLFIISIIISSSLSFLSWIFVEKKLLI
ncbi:acyltransferase [Paenibacillus sp. FSL H8-0048]|uniref:acyltransferase family protein n=1 Tax=Paenibacillus sp. FSL H8-0048 TaxID=2954508 RepID=UPI0030FAA001